MVSSKIEILVMFVVCYLTAPDVEDWLVYFTWLSFYLSKKCIWYAGLFAQMSSSLYAKI